MTLEHVAIWTGKLEELKDYYVKYFGGMPNEKYSNEQNKFESYFLIFEAGARNNWHTHPAGQILICTEGRGSYQEKGKPIQTLHAGDVVKILPGVEHWHGASPTSSFTHIAININPEKGVVNWLKPVTDEEYNNK